MHTGKIPDSQILRDPTLPTYETWYPGRAVCDLYRGELVVMALDFFAARDNKRRMWLDLA